MGEAVFQGCFSQSSQQVGNTMCLLGVPVVYSAETGYWLHIYMVMHTHTTWDSLKDMYFLVLEWYEFINTRDRPMSHQLIF